MNLPNKPISIAELEQARRENARALGIRFTRMPAKMALQMVVAHNSKFAKKSGNPFPATPR